MKLLSMTFTSLIYTQEKNVSSEDSHKNLTTIFLNRTNKLFFIKRMFPSFSITILFSNAFSFKINNSLTCVYISNMIFADQIRRSNNQQTDNSANPAVNVHSCYVFKLRPPPHVHRSTIGPLSVRVFYFRLFHKTLCICLQSQQRYLFTCTISKTMIIMKVPEILFP